MSSRRHVLACRDNLDFMHRLRDQKFKLIVTSPPYNLGKSYEGRESLDAYLSMQEEVIKECVRLLHPEGSICWQVGNYVDNGEIVPLDTLLYPIFQSQGLKLRNRVIWHFGHGLHCTKRLSGRYETINWWTKGDDYTWNLDPIRVPAKYPDKKHFKGPNIGKPSGNPKGKNPSDVWMFPNVKSNHVEKTIHPCQFPVELVERLVLSMTNEGDAVFDPYVGVGSTIVAALMHGRIGYGCDVTEEYVEIARDRLASLHEGTLRVRPMGLPVYDPALPNGGQHADRRALLPSQRRGVPSRPSAARLAGGSRGHRGGRRQPASDKGVQGEDKAWATPLFAEIDERGVQEGLCAPGMDGPETLILGDE